MVSNPLLDRVGALQQRVDALATLTKSEPRPLYVSRPVLNAAEIIRWAKGEGFSSCLPADDLHVTVAYSKRPVNWMAIEPEGWPEDGSLTVPAGGPRVLERLGPEGKATVLRFSSWQLAWRHQQIRDAGASWDWPEYCPHVTLSYDAADLDLDGIVAWNGPIRLGPERFEAIKEDWAASVTEKRRPPGRR